VIVTVAGPLSANPSFTINWITYVPTTSAANVACTPVALVREALLPAGKLLKVQRYVRGLPSTSVDPDPSNWMTEPIFTRWFGPALATGEVLPVVTCTVHGALVRLPSLTISCAIYVPAFSAMNVGATVLGPVSDATLPAGLEIRVQEKVSGAPFTSDEPPPLRTTFVPSRTVCCGPAFATGGECPVLMVTVAVSLPTPLVTVRAST
jgi:hypothetical protein